MQDNDFEEGEAFSEEGELDNDHNMPSSVASKTKQKKSKEYHSEEEDSDANEILKQYNQKNQDQGYFSSSSSQENEELKTD